VSAAKLFHAIVVMGTAVGCGTDVVVDGVGATSGAPPAPGSGGNASGGHGGTGGDGGSADSGSGGVLFQPPRGPEDCGGPAQFCCVSYPDVGCFCKDPGPASPSDCRASPDYHCEVYGPPDLCCESRGQPQLAGRLPTRHLRVCLVRSTDRLRLRAGRHHTAGPVSAWRELPVGDEAARRPLPEHDDTIAALSPRDRERVGAAWCLRAESESAAAAMFATLARGLFAERVPHPILWLASRSVLDELRHAEICLAVAARYGVAGAHSAPPPADEVRFGHADVRTSRLLHVVLNCCISEAIASACLRACLERAEGPLVSAALRELLTDEVDHARVGYALLAADPPGAAFRKEVERALPTLLRIARDSWVTHPASPGEPWPPGHGCLDADATRAVVDDAIASLVLPGFAHAGIEVPAAASR
jgi:hypothetical protein